MYKPFLDDEETAYSEIFSFFVVEEISAAIPKTMATSRWYIRDILTSDAYLISKHHSQSIGKTMLIKTTQLSICSREIKLEVRIASILNKSENFADVEKISRRLRGLSTRASRLTRE